MNNLDSGADLPGYGLVTYEGPNGARTGLVRDGAIFDVAALTGRDADADMMALLGDWPAAFERISAASPSADARLAEDVTLLSPLPQPGAVYCAGANYADHAAEMAAAQGLSAPRPRGERSWHFVKSSRAVVGPDSDVPLPAGSQKVDWEVELAAVIGRTGKNISLEDALHYVAGYTVAIDFSARDLSRRADVPDQSPFKMDWLSHKNFDGSCPIGPAIVPAANIDDPQALDLSLSVNGVVKQDSTTANMIFSLAEQIRDLSARITLWPGDIILTGTPAGVGSSHGHFLAKGDMVRAQIDGLGALQARMA